MRTGQSAPSLKAFSSTATHLAGPLGRRRRAEASTSPSDSCRAGGTHLHSTKSTSPLEAGSQGRLSTEEPAPETDDAPTNRLVGLRRCQPAKHQEQHQRQSGRPGQQPFQSRGCRRWPDASCSVGIYPLLFLLLSCSSSFLPGSPGAVRRRCVIEVGVGWQAALRNPGAPRTVCGGRAPISSVLALGRGQPSLAAAKSSRCQWAKLAHSRRVFMPLTS